MPLETMENKRLCLIQLRVAFIDIYYSDWGKRTKKLANALKLLNLQQGDKVGTLAWNGYRHLEIYYATSCSGLICHTP